MGEQEALLKLSALCSRSEHSSGEMRDKMRRWGVPQDVAERVAERLVSERFVDDERFCRFFVRDKMRFDRWGRRKIDQALWAKGVDADIRGRVLGEVDEEQWTEILRPLIAAKRRSLKAADGRELNARLMRFAVGRGFSAEQAMKCIGGDCDADFQEEDFSD